MDSTILTSKDRIHHKTQSEEDIRAYIRYMMAECDRISQLNFAYSKCLAEGFSQGRIVEKFIITKNLLAKSSTLDFVQEITGLSPEEIIKL